VSYRDDVEVIRGAIILVVLGTSQEFLVVHIPEIRSLNGVVGVKSIRDPMFAVIISTSFYLHFVSYAVTLASFCSIDLDWRRLSSCIVSWVRGGVPLNVCSVSCIIDGVASGVGRSVCRALLAGLARASAAALAGALAAALAAGLTGCIT
jgi:hypothetical protein